MPGRTTRWRWIFTAGSADALGLALVLLLGCEGDVGAGGDSSGWAGANVPGAGAGMLAPGNAAGAGGSGTAAGGGAGSGAAGMGLPSPDPADFPAGGPQPREIGFDGDPIYTRFMRLTNEQWRNAVNDLLGFAPTEDLTQAFEQPVLGATDFGNNEHNLTVTNAQWEAYQLAAEEAATRATATPSALAKVYSGTDGADFIRNFGRRAFRRPLAAEEETRYGQLFAVGQALSGDRSPLQKGAGLVIQAMLQSPHFLYRSELGAEGAPLTGYEVASKLSFWLLRTTPSDALLDAAGQGQLDTEVGLLQTARDMLQQDRARETMREFYRQLFDFDRYRTISKLNVPSYTEELNDEFEQSSYLFFERIFSQDLGVREILTGTVGFVGPRMAALYQVAPPQAGFEERDLGPQRAGYFTQLPFLTLHAFNEDPDPIHRGVSLNLDVLCANPGNALPDLPPVPPIQAGQTNRQRIETLTGGCGGECHNHYINPIGFAFESFDGMGQLRSEDHGLPVDTSASYPFVEGVLAYDNAAELMQLMAEGSQAHVCHAKKLAGFALQRDIVETDAPMLSTLAQISQSGGSVKEVMLELVKQPAFRNRAGAR